MREWLRRAGTGLAGGGVLLLGLLSALALRRESPTPAERRGHEPSDVSTTGVLVAGGLLVAGLAASLVAVSWLQVVLTGYPVSLRPPAAGVASAPMEPSALPQLEPMTGSPSRPRPFAASADDAGRRLSSYGWVDREAGIVRIPIDRAMDLLAERGLPARAGPDPFAEVVAAPSASGRFVERRVR
jgi:hypothetical protein